MSASHLELFLFKSCSAINYHVLIIISLPGKISESFTSMKNERSHLSHSTCSFAFMYSNTANVWIKNQILSFLFAVITCSNASRTEFQSTAMLLRQLDNFCQKIKMRCCCYVLCLVVFVYFFLSMCGKRNSLDFFFQGKWYNMNLLFFFKTASICFALSLANLASELLSIDSVSVSIVWAWLAHEVLLQSEMREIHYRVRQVGLLQLLWPQRSMDG